MVVGCWPRLALAWIISSLSKAFFCLFHLLSAVHQYPGCFFLFLSSLALVSLVLFFFSFLSSSHPAIVGTDKRERMNEREDGGTIL